MLYFIIFLLAKIEESVTWREYILHFIEFCEFGIRASLCTLFSHWIAEQEEKLKNAANVKNLLEL